MSDRRYVNLIETKKKWKNQYFGDFEAPLALFPTPVPLYFEVQECVGAGLGYIKTFDNLVIGSSVLIGGVCWEVFNTSIPEPITLEYTTEYVDCATCQAAQPSPTPTPTVTPTITPSITPSITPTVTPSTSVVLSPTPTPTVSSTPASSSTPTPTPTPSSSPLVQYNILAENSDEIITENSIELIIESAPTVGANYVIVGAANTNLIEYSYTGYDINDTGVSTPNYFFGDITYDNTRWLAVGGNGAENVYESTDGITFNNIFGNNLFTLQTVTAFIEWNGSYYLAGGDSSTGKEQLAKSADGITWLPMTSLPTAVFGTTVRDAVWTGSKWWAIQGGATSGIVWESTDGENWIDHSVNIGDGFVVAYDGTNDLVIGGDNGIEYSTDGGNTWIPSGGITGRITDILYDGSQWVAVGDELYYTTNLSTWIQGTYPTLNQMQSVTYDGNNYLSAGRYSILSSSDGQTWTNVITPGTYFYEGIFSKNRPDLIPSRQ